MMQSFQMRGSRGAAGGGADGLLLTDLVAHWDLTEGSGTRADSHTGGFDLTDINSVGSAIGPDGVTTCAEFAASNRYLTVAHNAAFNPGDAHMMINIWAYPVGGSGSYPGIICKGNAGGADRCWSIYSGASAHDPQGFLMRFRRFDNASTNNGFTPVSFAKSAWHMLSLYHDPDADQVRSYVNGALVRTDGFSGGVFDGTSDITVGATDAGGLRFYGRAQAASVWIGAGAQTALAELAWLYNTGAAARLYADLESYNP